MQEGKLIHSNCNSLNKILILNLIPEDFAVLSFITNWLIAAKWLFLFDNDVL